MNTFTVTATELRKNAADILNHVYYEKKIALVERAGRIIVRIEPVSDVPRPMKSHRKKYPRLVG